MNKMLKSRLIYQTSKRLISDFKRYSFPTTFENVVFPPDGQMKLPQLPMEPTYDLAAGERKYKATERMVEARGVEEVHTSLIHKQYGLAATRINKNLATNQFAIWRVPAPWLPRTKKAQGVKLGGGKGSIHHYVTPVRAKRIILEVGGYITRDEAYGYLAHFSAFIPFPVEFVSEEILQERLEYEREVKLYNQNRFDWDFVINLLLHWDEATRTHCGVPNWLPSVSAAVASYAPERYIWRLFIGIHGSPRIVLAIAYRNLILKSPLGPARSLVWFPLACNFACFLNIVEVVCLLLLTSISSIDDYFLHKLAFIGFATCGICFMFLSTWLYDKSGRRRTSQLGEKSFQYKVSCCAISTISLFMALYFFYRHNTYCETGIYTLFALCEYSVIIFNILFHSTLYYDFHSRHFSLLSAVANFQVKSSNRCGLKSFVRQPKDCAMDKKRQILLNACKHENMPRKQKPFLNFLKSSGKCRDEKVAMRVWESFQQCLEWAKKAEAEAQKVSVEPEIEAKVEEASAEPENGVQIEEPPVEPPKKKKKKHRASVEPENEAKVEEASIEPENEVQVEESPAEPPKKKKKKHRA
ncbi:Ribosomal-L16 domain-containing protein [Aphelenchoides bicaudatus]|nr:Ribosomal-L16 domain-containing protein [Aphelenchoides bicaudatus]